MAAWATAAPDAGMRAAPPLSLMKRIGTGILLIAAVVYVVLWGPPLLLVALQLLVSLVGLWEYFRLAEAAGHRSVRWPGYVFAVLLGLVNALFNRTQIDTSSDGYASVSMDPTSTWILAVLLMLLMLASIAAMKSRESLSGYFGAVASTLFGPVYVALPLALLVSVCMQFDGPTIVLFAMVVIWVGDTSGYVIGKSIGKHNSSPRISPNKTWEGTIASFVAALLVGLFTALYIWGGEGMAGYAEPILLAAVLNVAGQFGDLAESALKRSAGVKDSSNLLPGHGGVLDRIDALLFAAPVLWYYWLWQAG